MARPKSDEKREAILAAAARVFAARGLAAPTSAISQAAGIAEGSLFTYFRTKDELLNALYREFKTELAEVMMSEFGRKKHIRGKLHHIWDCYVNWGVAHPDQRRVLAMLQVSGAISEETKAAGAIPFAEIETMARDAVEQGVVRDIPFPFVAATMEKLAENAMEFMAAYPAQAAKYRMLGFEVVWNGIRKR